MKRLLIAFFLLFIIKCDEKQDQQQIQQQIIEFTDADFEQNVYESQEPWVIYFYSDNANSKKLFNKWQQLPEKVKEIHDYGINFGQINSKENPETVKKYKILASPVLKYFRQGQKLVELVGGFQQTDWSLQGIAKSVIEQYENIEYHKKESQRKSLEEEQRRQEQIARMQKEKEIHKEGHVSILTDKNYENFLKLETIKFIFFFAESSKKCQSIHKIWEELAIKYEDNIEFAKLDIAKYKELVKTLKVKIYPTLKLYVPGMLSERQYVYQGEKSLSEIEKYLEQKLENYEKKKDL